MALPPELAEWALELPSTDPDVKPMWTLSPRVYRRGLQMVALLGVSLAGACGSKAPPKAARPAVAVTLGRVKRASVPYTIVANGVVTPLQTATVAAQVDGLVTQVSFREGQEVTKGQVLFKIDQRPYLAAFQQATAVLQRDKANAAIAKAQFDRYNALVQSGVVTREQVDQLRATMQATAATVEADSAAVGTAKFNLDNTTVRAPISGRTGALLVREGNLVRSGGGTALVTINQVRPILVRFAAPASELRNILKYGHGQGQGLPVTAEPSAASGGASPADTAKPAPDADAARKARAVGAPTADGAADSPASAKGKLFFIDNAVDTTTGTVQLKAQFENGDGSLWAGQFVNASLQLYVEEGAVVVPTEAVVTGQRGTYVWVVDDSMQARDRPVTVSRTAGPISVITAGLSEGERVVTTGQSRLSPGAKVELRGADGSGGGGRGGRGGRGRKGGADSSAAGGAKADAPAAGDAAGGKGKDAAGTTPAAGKDTAAAEGGRRGRGGRGRRGGGSGGDDARG